MKHIDADRDFIQECLYRFSDKKIEWLAEECLKIYTYKNKKERKS